MACRLCTANDRDALVEELAAGMWHNEADGRSWEEAGSYWQPIFRAFAERALNTMTGTRHEHVEHAMSA